MARKKAPEEHENHERWLVSYADFITLLFAFFVVLYSISSVNEGKYRVLSDSLVSSFRSQPKSIQPIQVGVPSKSPVSSTAQENMKSPALVKLPKMFVSQSKSQEGEVRDPLKGEQFTEGADLVALKKIADDVKEALASLVEQGLITVHQEALWVEIEIKDSILFTSASARLQEQAKPVLDELAQIFSEHDNSIRVEGFTDNLPINTVVYPSNWELSAARASSVVRLFVKHGIAPDRMVAQGYGEYRPITENDTPEGRAKNRRVVIVVLADKLVEQLLYEYGHTAEVDDIASDVHVADLLEQTAEIFPDEPSVDSMEEMIQPFDEQPVELPGELKSENKAHRRHAQVEAPAAAAHGLISPGFRIINPLGLAPFRLTSPIKMKFSDEPTDKGAANISELEAIANDGDTVSGITQFE